MNQQMDYSNQDNFDLGFQACISWATEVVVTLGPDANISLAHSQYQSFITRQNWSQLIHDFLSFCDYNFILRVVVVLSKLGDRLLVPTICNVKINIISLLCKGKYHLRSFSCKWYLKFQVKPRLSHRCRCLECLLNLLRISGRKGSSNKLLSNLSQLRVIENRLSKKISTADSNMIS